MRLDTAREQTITNLGGAQKFKMNASAKAFQILSSGIYERKEEAIVRELGCNAHDSHIMAGKGDVPFKVHLPTPIDPVFSVEDFGVGLSEWEVAGGFRHLTTGEKVVWSIADKYVKEWQLACQKAREDGRDQPEHPYLSNGYEEVGGVYTTYFESTKTDSNDVIGALGLGSKTPFSYTDSFTIVARKDGKECVFTASISQTGEPEVVKLYERPTVEHSGVKVSLEVSDRDIHKFISCAEKVYSWFQVKPTCNKSLNYDISDDVIDNINQYGYHLRANEGGYGRYADCKVIMGNVAYDLKLNDIADSSDEDFNKFLEQLDNIKADLYFSVAIGDADVAASRETLSLDERTIKNLQDHLRLIRDTFVQNTEDKVKKMRSVYEAYFNLTSYERSLIKDFDINGHTIKELVSGEGRFLTTRVKSTEDAEVSAIADDYDFTIYGDYGVRNYTNRSKRSDSDNFFRLIQKQSDGSFLFPVVINDCERKMGLKDALVANNSLPDKVLVVSDKNTKLTPRLEKLLNYVTKGCYYVIYTSSFWDGKLAAGKKSSTGLADEVVKARVVTTDNRFIDYRKVDLSTQDKSRWAYADSAMFGDAKVCGKIVSRSKLLDLMAELDLDGVIIYNANNGKKVKRILSQDLDQMVKSKGNARDICIGQMKSQVNMGENQGLKVFTGFQSLVETVNAMEVEYYVCSTITHGNMNVAAVLQTLTDRIEVFKQSRKFLMESGDPMLTVTLKHGNFNDANLVNQVREYIKQRKEK